MRILISTILSTKQRTGVAVYLEHLIKHLQVLDSQNEYYILVSNENKHFFPITKNNFQHILINVFEISRIALRIQYYFIHKFIIPRKIKYYKIDLFHMPCPWFISIKFPTIVTIHDLVEIGRNKYSPILNWVKQKMIFSSLRNSIQIITVSDTSAKKIQSLTNKKVVTIRHGVPNIDINVSYNDQYSLEEMNLEKNKYFIFVGTLLKHKNLTVLIDAFIRFLNFNKYFKLVLIGKLDNAYNQIKDVTNKYRREIILTGYMADNSKKSNLIRNSTALILPSHDEGFGFPILEANLLGAPVIASDIPPMKEIAGDSALLINTTSSAELLDAMIKISQNNKLRDDFIRRGTANMLRFSWETAASNTIKVYNEVFSLILS